MTEWVTEPGALTAIIALGGIMVGDEVRIGPCDAYDLPGESVLVGRTARITHVSHTSSGREFRYLTDVRSDHQTAYMTLVPENIVAWRRPS